MQVSKENTREDKLNVNELCQFVFIVLVLSCSSLHSSDIKKKIFFCCVLNEKSIDAKKGEQSTKIKKRFKFFIHKIFYGFNLRLCSPGYFQ